MQECDLNVFVHLLVQMSLLDSYILPDYILWYVGYLILCCSLGVGLTLTYNYMTV